MTWIRTDVSGPDHPKVLRLSRKLRIERYHAWGLVSGLWCWVARLAPDGDLSSFEGREVRTGSHCFGCTAGAGSSCGGALSPG